MKPGEAALLLWMAVGAVGCEQLGNPRQYATPPAQWRNAAGHLITTTRSFKSPKTIRRMVSDGMEDLDYTSPSIGPSQTLTYVDVVARSFRETRRGKVDLVTRFELPNGRRVERTWQVVPGDRRWSAAFALPDAPEEAVTAVVP